MHTPDKSRRSDSLAPDTTGVSEVVGLVLVVGFVFVGIAGIVSVAGPQLTANQETVEVEQAEQALTQFDSAAHRVAVGGTPTQQVDLGLRGNAGTLDVHNDGGRVTIEYVNATTNASTELLNTTLGAVVYENDETTVGYQGGGVWRSDGDGSVMVSPPEIAYRGETLTMPIVRTNGEDVYSEISVKRADSTATFPNATAGMSNRLDAGKLRITIHSRYYKAWGTYFEEAGNTIVRYDHARQAATIVFFGYPDNVTPGAGVVATSSSGYLRVEGTGAYVDSYNSSQDAYTSSQSDEGILKIAGDVTTSGNSEIAGDLWAGGDVNVGGSSLIDGNVTTTGEITGGNGGGGNGGGGGGVASITGTTAESDSSVLSKPPIDQLVNEKQVSVRNDNHNAETPVIVDNELQITAQNDALGPGRYYLKNLDLDGETLVLNTTGGDVTIVVRNWVRLLDGSEIEVQGNGTAQVFVASENQIDESIPGGGQAPSGLQDGVHFIAKYGATIDVHGDDSKQFQVYAPRHFEGAIRGSQGKTPDITATIVAPAGSTGSGQFFVMQGDLKGAIMTGRLTLGQYGQVHFDRSILNADLQIGSSFAWIDYLYVTEYEVEVTGT